MHVSIQNTEHPRFRSLPLGAVSLSDGFWARRQATNRQVSLRHGYRKLNEFGNFDNLRLAAGASAGPSDGSYRGPVFMDSDLYKWLEAVAYDLGQVPDAGLEAMAGEAIDLIVAAQRPDGYLNSYWQVVKPDQRWSDLDLGHELYCAGHLFEAAVAFHRAMGDGRLLEVACRFADYIASVFGPGKREAAGGHPEIELALVELYRETGEHRYLDLAQFFVDQRGRGVLGTKSKWFGPSYYQDRVPVREATVVEGHAVRQLYLASGVTDLYLETGEQALLEAMFRLWSDMTGKKMHLTGGFGARHEGEAFGDAYELPSDRCYCETCATIAAMMWSWRMLLATGEGRYADLLERCLYNGFLSGVSLDGQRYFYVNPLLSRGGIERPEWYGCACCPPNVMRQIAMLGHYVATSDATGIQIHQYMPARVRPGPAGGRDAALRLEAGYPWDGHVRIVVEESGDEPWRLALRVPGWCRGAGLSVNGEPVQAGQSHGYAVVERAWRPGDTLELDLPMPVRLTAANPRVDAIRASLAIERGPLVYCLEEADQEPGIDLLDVRIDPAARPISAWQAGLLGGVVTVQVAGKVAVPDEKLYLPAGQEEPAQRDTTLTAVPYFAWANRGPGAMRVWIPRG